MSSIRTANLLGALCTAVGDRLDERPRGHPNENDSSAAALHLIERHGGCSNLQLSQALGRSHPATVRLVDKLEQARLVLRRPGVDRRTIALHLTPAGRKRTQEILDERALTLQGIAEALSPEQLQQLNDIAETLLSALVRTPVGAAQACRLCDEARCPTDRCPVHRRALELLSGAPDRDLDDGHGDDQ